jgi:hypothetical protein
MKNYCVSTLSYIRIPIVILILSRVLLVNLRGAEMKTVDDFRSVAAKAVSTTCSRKTHPTIASRFLVQFSRKCFCQSIQARHSLPISVISTVTTPVTTATPGLMRLQPTWQRCSSKGSATGIATVDCDECGLDFHFEPKAPDRFDVRRIECAAIVLQISLG